MKNFNFLLYIFIISNYVFLSISSLMRLKEMENSSNMNLITERSEDTFFFRRNQLKDYEVYDSFVTEYLYYQDPN